MNATVNLLSLSRLCVLLQEPASEVRSAITATGIRPVFDIDDKPLFAADSLSRLKNHLARHRFAACENVLPISRPVV